MLVSKGVDLAITGVSLADKVTLKALSTVDVEEGFFIGYTCLFYRLFTWESEKDVSIVPLGTGDPMKFEYDGPMDGMAGRSFYMRLPAPQTAIRRRTSFVTASRPGPPNFLGSYRAGSPESVCRVASV